MFRKVTLNSNLVWWNRRHKYLPGCPVSRQILFRRLFFWMLQSRESMPSQRNCSSKCSVISWQQRFRSSTMSAVGIREDEPWTQLSPISKLFMDGSSTFVESKRSLSHIFDRWQHLHEFHLMFIFNSIINKSSNIEWSWLIGRVILFNSTCIIHEKSL